MNLGEKLKQLRLEKNLTQKQLADRLGVAISAISSYESDTRCPTFDTLIKYARIFHVSTDYLLGLEPILLMYPVSQTQKSWSLPSLLISFEQKNNDSFHTDL